MIKAIRETYFPEDANGNRYATLDHATVSLQDMGEKTVTTQVEIDGGITPDFSKDWEVEFGGEKYVMPLREPQGAKENTSLDSTIDLTFQHWAVYQLKRWYFFTVQTVGTNTVVPDKYMGSVSLNLRDFCDLFGQVLRYYYGDTITMDFNDPDAHENGWDYDPSPTSVEISHSYIWDVLVKMYELYAVRWQIEPNGDADHYVIKVGYPATDISHIFEYGFEGGLLKVERQVQDDNIRNMIIGRGGDKNLPLRYFKDKDGANDTFSPDPDWIPELAVLPMTELRGATFRSYVQGWKTKHHGGASVTEAGKAYAPWAWQKGYTDATFDPVEFVADEITAEAQEGDRHVEIFPDYAPAVKKGSSIDKYGPLLGGLENDEETYPSIQGVTVDGLGRIDEAVWVEQVTSDDVEASAENHLSETHFKAGASAPGVIVPDGRVTFEMTSDWFSVPEGSTGLLDIGTRTVTCFRESQHFGRPWEDPKYYRPVSPDKVEIGTVLIRVYDAEGNEHSVAGLKGGSYYFRAEIPVHNMHDVSLLVTVAYEKARVVITSGEDERPWNSLFRIYVKNIWETRKGYGADGKAIPGETEAEYAERVWTPILGDRIGNEAKVVFSDGLLSTSEDYEFIITEMPEYKKARFRFLGKDGQEHEYDSEWCLTLAKSEAELERTGLYVPNTKKQGAAGDHFFFTGIDMPHKYVEWAERRLDDRKKDELRKSKGIKPTWVVGLDKVRIHDPGEAGALISQIRPGATLTLFDRRFIPGSSQEKLHVQSVTYMYEKPTDKEAKLLPEVEIVLSDKYEVSANPVSALSGEISAIGRQLGSIGNIEQIVRAVGDKLYLRKDGFADRSMSPTEFWSLLTSGGFRQGSIGGSGWGFYRDSSGRAVLEADVLRARKAIEANNLVINQISVQGGKVIESAAYMEVTRVLDTADGYVCYFDQKGGTVKNLFKVGDVALSEVFDPSLARSKYYKRRVTATGADNITLTKGYAAVTLPDGTTDTGVNGNGIPMEGDVISHYGSYTDPSRRYVKVRDVIGGGYERYLEGLDSVNSDGTEYYFAGRQEGQTPRWCVGTPAAPRIEYKDNRLTLDGVELSVNSKIGGATAGEVADRQVGGTNLMLRSAEEHKAIHQVDYELSERLADGQTYTASVWPHPDDGPTFYTWDVRALDESGEDLGILGRTKSDPRGSKCVLTFTYSPAIVPDKPPKKIRLSTPRPGTYRGILRAKLEKGNVPTDWSASPYESMDRSTDYLKEALKNNTLISNGLMLTSNIQMGYDDAAGQRVTTAGMNGIVLPDTPDASLMLWAGGEQLDAETNPGAGAAFGVRMDGSGYFARNTVRFKENLVELGDNVKVTPESFSMTDKSGVTVLSLVAEEIPYNPKTSVQSQRKITDTFVKTGDVSWYSPVSQSLWRSATLPEGDYALPTVDKGGVVLGKVALSVRMQMGTDEKQRDFKNTLVSLKMIAKSGESFETLGTWEDKNAWTGKTVSSVNGMDTVEYTREVTLVWQNSSTYTDNLHFRLAASPTGTAAAASSRAATFSVRFDLTLGRSAAKLNMAGSNGFAALWGEARFLITESGAAIGYGDKYIRFGADGIKISRGGGTETDL